MGALLKATVVSSAKNNSQGNFQFSSLATFSNIVETKMIEICNWGIKLLLKTLLSVSFTSRCAMRILQNVAWKNGIWRKEREIAERSQMFSLNSG